MIRCICLQANVFDHWDYRRLNYVYVTILHAADCGAPPPPVSGSLLQPYTNTTEGSVVVFQCDPGFVPEGEMTAVCGSDGQWSPNPGDVTCSPRPTQTFTQTITPTSTQAPTQAPTRGASTPTKTSTPTGHGENELLEICT